jgi:asparagine synthase (glutamine-hydrolysing)
VPAPVRRLLAAPIVSLIPESGWYKSMGHQLRWLHRISFLKGGERYAASLTYFYFERDPRAALFSDAAARELRAFDAEDDIRIPFETAEGDRLDRMLYADTKVRLPDHPVMITDRMTMAHGLEARSPFMDHRLVEFVARLRSSLKVKGRSLRLMQKRLLARYLPKQMLARPKQGFSSALPYLLRDEYRQLHEQALSDSALVRAGILRQEPISALLHSHVSGKADHGNRLWLLVNAELWYRMMILGESREAMRVELAEKGCRSTARGGVVPASSSSLSSPDSV